MIAQSRTRHGDTTVKHGLSWRQEYNEERPKKALGGLTPAAYARRLMTKPSTVTAGLQVPVLINTGGRQFHHGTLRHLLSFSLGS